MLVQYLGCHEQTSDALSIKVLQDAVFPIQVTIFKSRQDTILSVRILVISGSKYCIDLASAFVHKERIFGSIT